MCLVALLIGAVGSVALNATQKAHADPVGTVYPNVYPGAGWTGSDDMHGYTQFDQAIVPQLLTSRLFLSAPWNWVGTTSGGYEGIQTMDLPSGHGGDIAIFSVWDAIAATPSAGSTCNTFENEGTGMSCHAPLPIVVGHRYAVHVAVDHITGSFQWWRGTVTDTTAAITKDLGMIEANTTQPMTAPGNFMEYFGDTAGASCDQYPYAISDFGTPTLVSAVGGTSAPAALRTPPDVRDCAKGAFTVTADGVRIAFGGPQPFVIRNLTAHKSGTTANLAWANPISNGGSSILNVTIETSSDSGTTWTTAATKPAGTTSATLTGLAANLDLVRVAAVNAAGTGIYAIAGLTPPANDNFASPRVISGASGSIAGENLLATTQPGEPDPFAPSGHSIWYRFTPTMKGKLTVGDCTSQLDTILAAYTGSSLAALTQIAVNDNGCGDDATLTIDVTAGVAYQIRLAGYGDAASAITFDWSFVGVPTAPRTPAAAPGNGTATVSWTQPLSANGSPVTGYVVTPYLGAAAQTARVFNNTVRTQSITGLTNAKAYTFKVAAKNAAGTGPQSVASTAIIVGAPAAPGAVTVTPGNAAATISWTAPANNGAAVTTDAISVYAGATLVRTVSFAVTTQHVVTGLTNGTNYTFKVTATNPRGTGPASSATGIVGAPRAPTAVTATAASASATLHWTAPGVTNGSAITAYVVTPFLAGVAQAAVTFASATTTETVSGLTAGKSYTFKVAAKNARGVGPQSAPSNAVTPT